MGTIIHDAIVVTARSLEHLKPAHEKATACGLPCSLPVASPVNGYVTFVIAPDGSKELWADSEKGDDSRGKWVAWAEQHGNGLEWVHVRYGLDAERPSIAASSDDE